MVTVDGIGRELDEEILPLLTNSNNVFILSNKYSRGYHRNCVHRSQETQYKCAVAAECSCVLFCLNIPDSRSPGFEQPAAAEQCAGLG